MWTLVLLTCSSQGSGGIGGVQSMFYAAGLLCGSVWACGEMLKINSCAMSRCSLTVWFPG